MKTKTKVGALSFCVLFVLSIQSALAQNSDKLDVFVDCQGGDCDFDHIRQNVTFVNYVYERKDADVHVLVTSQSAATGKENQLRFIGLREYADKDQVLKFFANSTNTESEHRQQFLQVFTLGLMRYVSETPLAQNVKITVEDDSSVKLPADDPWDSWIMRLSLNGYMSGEESFTYQMFNGYASGNRITEQWKFNLGIGGNFREANYQFSDGSSASSGQNGYYYNSRAIKSLGEHWGLGAGVIGERDTYNNLGPSVQTSLAVEYNFFPYQESSDRSFTILYFSGVTALNYDEVTVFGKLQETRFSEGIQVEFKKKRPWGDSSISTQLSHFGYTDQYRMIVGTDNTWRIAKGLTFDISADAKRVNDQLYLPRGDISNEDVLIRRRAQRTSFEYSLQVGITFTFGSIYNNTVNSRLASARFFSQIF